MLGFDFLKKFFKRPEQQKENSPKQENISSKKEVVVINVTEPSERARQELLQNWSKFADYNEILQIDEADRQNLLNDIYENWCIHGVPKFFREKYSQYDPNLIEQIVMREKNRIDIRTKVYHYKNMTEASRNRNPFWFDFLGCGSTLTGKGADFLKASCAFDDLLKLNLTNNLECFFENGKFAGLNVMTNYQGIIRKENQNPIKFYHNGELHIMDKKGFKKYREENNLELYLDSIEANQKLWKEILKEKNIPFDENKQITKKFFFEALKKYKEGKK